LVQEKTKNIRNSRKQNAEKKKTEQLNSGRIKRNEGILDDGMTGTLFLGQKRMLPTSTIDFVSLQRLSDSEFVGTRRPSFLDVDFLFACEK
jgi:hypothetical protein